MIVFNDITPSEKDCVTPYIMQSNYRGCDLSFSNLCCWRFMYHTVYAHDKAFLFLKFWIDGQVSYMLPVGEGDLVAAIDALIEDARMVEGTPLFRMSGINAEQKQMLETLMPGRFTFTTDRNYYDYIYLRSDLASLAGKKLQSKRNFVNRFKRTYNYTYRPIDKQMIPECLRLEAEWCRVNNCNSIDGTSNERQAVINGLTYFDELGLTGGTLWVDDRMVAFTFGMPINADTFGVQVEKADTTIEGAYAMINHEFANHIPETFVYMNREEDLGLEGLRKAKLSYHPAILLEKYVAKLHL